VLPLTVLERNKNMILYEIPPGKPDPRQRCALHEESRNRVLQSGVKGGACWYYTFNFLRRRIGKNACSELSKAREIEKACSQRRKELTAYDNAFPLSIAELYSQSNISLLKHCDLEKGQLLLDSQILNLPFVTENLEGGSSLVPYLQEFLREKKHANLYEFLIFKRSSKIIEIDTEFLKHFNFDMQTLTTADKWKKLDIEQQAAAIDAIVRDISADIYKLKRSTWKPLHGIDKLIEELKEKGPLNFFGLFGPTTYKLKSDFKHHQVSGRDIFAWRPKTPRNGTAGHSVLVVGAKKVHDKAYVYFIDPIDSSDPLDRSKQKIYMNSIENFTSNICDLAGHKRMDSKVEYAYHGHFRII
jgi:hypothetical protein